MSRKGKLIARRDISIVNERYLRKLGVKTGVSEKTIGKLEKGSTLASQLYAGFGNRPPLLSLSEELERRFITIPEDMVLKPHKNTKKCPPNIVEVTPVQEGCQINCQYCLTFSLLGLQKEVLVFSDYASWFREQLHANRVKNSKDRGTMYYFSPKTEAFSPQMVRDGITGSILGAFADHVNDETSRMGMCPDTLMIITKAGVEDIQIQSPSGRTLLEILLEIPNNMQISASIAHLDNNLELREALEPGARPKSSRLNLVKMLQHHGILIQGALVQPVFHVFEPDEKFLGELWDAGIRRISLDMFTTTPENLAIIAQIFGWFDKEAERRMFEDYLSSDAPSKDGIRRGISKELQFQIYGRIIEKARKIGFKVSYCRFVKKYLGLEELNYGEDGICPSGGCMANITAPTPEFIETIRKNQANFGNGGHL